MPAAQILLLFAALAAATIWAVKRTRRHARTLDHGARKLALTVAARDDLGLTHRCRELRLMQAGHHRRTSDVTCGSQSEGRLTVFTLACETGMANERQVVRQTVVVLQTARSRPGLYFSRRAPLEPVGAFSTYSSVPIAADERGEAWLQVETPWKPAVGAALRQWLLEQPPTWTFECRGPLVAGYGPVARGSEQEAQLVDAVRTLTRRLDETAAVAGLGDHSDGNNL